MGLTAGRMLSRGSTPAQEGRHYNAGLDCIAARPTHGSGLVVADSSWCDKRGALCLAGIDKLIFIYSSPLPAMSASCRRDGQDILLAHKQALVMRKKDDARKYVFAGIHAKIMASEPKLILLHDFAGRHAAGFIAALILRQFCGIDGPTAKQYWLDTAGDVPVPSKASILWRIEHFEPYPDWHLDYAQRQVYCPAEALPKTKTPAKPSPSP